MSVPHTTRHADDALLGPVAQAAAARVLSRHVSNVRRAKAAYRPGAAGKPAPSPSVWGADSAAVLVHAPRSAAYTLGYNTGDRVHTASGRAAYIRGIAVEPGKSPRLWAAYTGKLEEPEPRDHGRNVRAKPKAPSSVAKARTNAGTDAFRKAHTNRAAVASDVRLAYAAAGQLKLGKDEVSCGTGGVATVEPVRVVPDYAAEVNVPPPHLSVSGRLDALRAVPQRAACHLGADKFSASLRPGAGLRDAITDRERFLELASIAHTAAAEMGRVGSRHGRAREFLLPARPSHVRSSARFDALYDGGDARPYIRSVDEGQRDGFVVFKFTSDVDYLARLNQVQESEAPLRVKDYMATPSGLRINGIAGTTRKPTIVSLDSVPNSPGDDASETESEHVKNLQSVDSVIAGMDTAAAIAAVERADAQAEAEALFLASRMNQAGLAKVKDVAKGIPPETIRASRYGRLEAEKFVRSHRVYMHMTCGQERTWAPEKGPEGARRYGALDRTMPMASRIAARRRRHHHPQKPASHGLSHQRKHGRKREKDRTFYCPLEPMLPEGGDDNTIPENFYYSTSHPGEVLVHEMKFGAWDRKAVHVLRTGESKDATYKASVMAAAAQNAEKATKSKIGDPSNPMSSTRAMKAAKRKETHALEMKEAAAAAERERRAEMQSRRNHMRERFAAAEVRRRDVPNYCCGEDPVFIEARSHREEARAAVANGTRLPQAPRGELPTSASVLVSPRLLQEPPQAPLPRSLALDATYRGAHTAREWRGDALLADIVPVSATLEAQVARHESITEHMAIRHGGSLASLEQRVAHANDAFVAPERAEFSARPVDFGDEPGTDPTVPIPLPAPPLDPPKAQSRRNLTLTGRLRAADAAARHSGSLVIKRFGAYAQPEVDVASQCGYGPLRGAGGVGSSTTSARSYYPVEAAATRRGAELAVTNDD